MSLRYYYDISRKIKVFSEVRGIIVVLISSVF